MNFLDIAKTVRALAGIQGSGPTSVVDAVGIEATIVQFVKDANIDLQSLRDDFEFMQRETSFTTIVGKSTYTLSEIFNSSDPPLKTYKRRSVVLTDTDGKKRMLSFYDDEFSFLELEYLNDDTRKRPSNVGIAADHSMVLKPIPDNNYVVTFKYYRNPQILTLNTDIPLIPVAFHNLIVYKALEKTAVFLSQPELYRGYSVETARMTAQLMRTSVPKKRLQGRPMA